MVIELKREDCAKRIEPDKIFAEDYDDGHGVGGCGITAKGILEGFSNISRRKEVNLLEDMLLKSGGDEQED